MANTCEEKYTHLIDRYIEAENIISGQEKLIELFEKDAEEIKKKYFKIGIAAGAGGMLVIINIIRLTINSLI